MSGQTSLIAVIVHAAVFAIAFTYLRGTGMFEGFMDGSGCQVDADCKDASKPKCKSGMCASA